MTVVASLSIVFLLIAAVSLLTRFTSRADAPAGNYAADVSFLENFSLSSYRPMLRLASQMDRKYLAAAHGARLANCYRKIQRDLLREYLRNAARDFNRLYSIANAKAVQALDDPAELSSALVEQQMSFLMLMWGIEARLILDRLVPFAADLKPLIGQLEGLARQTNELLRPVNGYRGYGYEALHSNA